MSLIKTRRFKGPDRPVTQPALPEVQLSQTDMLAPLDAIETEHQKWLIVCDAMERVADKLPDYTAEPRLLGIASLCTRDAVARHHAMEQDGLFPLVKARIGSDDTLRAVLDCMEEDHPDLEDCGEEAAEILTQIRQESLTMSADGAGYGLRCFFAFMRRHVRCELRVVLPAARRLLVAGDEAMLRDLLTRHKRHDKVVPLEWFRRYATAG